MISLRHRLLAGLLPLLWSSTMVLSQAQPQPGQEHKEKQEAGGQAGSEAQKAGEEGGAGQQNKDQKQ